MATSLVGYVPVLNQRHLDWFQKYPNSTLYLIGQGLAQTLLPRLSRNIVGIPTSTMRAMMLGSLPTLGLRNVEILAEGNSLCREIVMPDEDISHLVAKHCLQKAQVSYEMIWARWDMTAIHKEQPVVPDATISSLDFDRNIMRSLSVEACKSPDWWRQIAAAVVWLGRPLVVACNTHMPNEYETYIFGDPRLNVDAGQKGKYSSLHAEQAVITQCVKHGFPLNHTFFYVSTFPCENCAREIAASGVSKLFFLEGYSSLNAFEVLKAGGVEIVQVIKDPVSS